jgi:Regulator of ribonuclease activity B
MIHPNDDNGDVLRRLQAQGDDLSQPRDIDFNVVFPDEVRATDFARQVRNEDSSATVRLENVRETHPWGVLIVKNMIPTHSGITQIEQELQRRAEPLGGYNDGWGCISQPPPEKKRFHTCTRTWLLLAWSAALTSTEV